MGSNISRKEQRRAQAQGIRRNLKRLSTSFMALINHGIRLRRLLRDPNPEISHTQFSLQQIVVSQRQRSELLVYSIVAALWSRAARACQYSRGMHRGAQY